MRRTKRPSAVLVFAKAPLAGRVKTRLAPLLGMEGAASLHARLVARTIAIANRAAVGAVQLHGDPIENDFLRACAGRHIAGLVQQQGRDLGERMLHAFQHALAQPNAGAILIGTDCPPLTARHLRMACKALRDGDDAAFLPTEDGGYALIALNRADPRVFEDVAWGTTAVMSQTRDRMNAIGWRWSELDTLWDVDRPADYERLVAFGRKCTIGL